MKLIKSREEEFISTMDGLIQKYKTELKDKGFENKTWNDLSQYERDIFIRYYDEYEAIRAEFAADEYTNLTEEEESHYDEIFKLVYDRNGREMFYLIFENQAPADLYLIIDKYTNENNSKGEVAYLEAKVSSDPIDYMQNKVIELQRWVVNLPVIGGQWYYDNRPTINNLNALIKWHSNENFELFIKALHRIAVYETYRGRVQYEESERLILEDELKNKLDDRLLALIPKFIAEEQKADLKQLCTHGTVKNKIRWQGANAELLIKYIAPIFYDGVFHTIETNLLVFLFDNFLRKNTGKPYSMHTLENNRQILNFE